MRRVFLYLLIFFEILLIISLVQGIRLSLKSQQRVATLAAAKRALEQEKEHLLTQLHFVQSPYYLEELARDQLHLSKPGETVVIVPAGAVATASASPVAVSDLHLPNWQKWWGVIMGQGN